MMKTRKSWREKLADSKDLPRVERIPEGMAKMWGTGTLVIPAPKEVDRLMRQVPRGKVTTINGIREALARKHKATIGCPITTGIFARIAAGAAAEEEAEGEKTITPYWRILKSGGEINPRYPGGVAGQKRRLEAEGHKVKAKGEKFFVENFERFLANLYDPEAWTDRLEP
jgi:alkylated DNA nucleotide flippase Atl1